MRNSGLNMKHLMTAAVLGLMLGGTDQAVAKPLKVFVLAGQSNLQGQAHVRTFDTMDLDPKTAPILKSKKSTAK
jgi:alpha-galactosidase